MTKNNGCSIILNYCETSGMDSLCDCPEVTRAGKKYNKTIKQQYER